jgi:hypothetical protein
MFFRFFLLVHEPCDVFKKPKFELISTRDLYAARRRSKVTDERCRVSVWPKVMSQNDLCK